MFAIVNTFKIIILKIPQHGDEFLLFHSFSSNYVFLYNLIHCDSNSSICDDHGSQSRRAAGSWADSAEFSVSPSAIDPTKRCVRGCRAGRILKMAAPQHSRPILIFHIGIVYFHSGFGLFWEALKPLSLIAGHRIVSTPKAMFIRWLFLFIIILLRLFIIGNSICILFQYRRATMSVTCCFLKHTWLPLILLKDGQRRLFSFCFLARLFSSFPPTGLPFSCRQSCVCLSRRIYYTPISSTRL